MTTKEISIFSNSSHFEWRAGLLDTILKGNHPRTIPAKFALIWFSGFRGEDLNVIFYHNMSNLYNQYKSVERKNSQNQRLPGACNRSPGSKLLSITTQLHCGGHLGGRAQLPDTILEEDHPMTIPSKFGFN